MSDASTNRRQFLRAAATVVAGTVVAPSRSRAAAGGSKFVVGVMGTGGRGYWLLDNDLVRRDNVDIAYLCDVDVSRLKAAAKLVENRTGKAPKTVTDFRKILDDKNVNVLFNATPDHWHALPTVWACQAGKDVYVEKPASHNIWEGRKMVEAARKYKRIVQLGTQTRSGPYTKDAVAFLRSGRIGRIHFVRVLNMKHRPPVKRLKDEPIPAGVDYEKWLGPAPMRPFNRNHYHYTWHWFWAYSGGDIINDGVHQIDAARYLIGRDYPEAVSCTGGKHAYDDAQETPDTQIVAWDYGDITMVFELTLWTPHMQKTPWDFRDTDGFPNWRFNATHIQLHGTKGCSSVGTGAGGRPSTRTMSRSPAAPVGTRIRRTSTTFSNAWNPASGPTPTSKKGIGPPCCATSATFPTASAAAGSRSTPRPNRSRTTGTPMPCSNARTASRGSCPRTYSRKRGVRETSVPGGACL